MFKHFFKILMLAFVLLSSTSFIYAQIAPGIYSPGGILDSNEQRFTVDADNQTLEYIRRVDLYNNRTTVTITLINTKSFPILNIDMKETVPRAFATSQDQLTFTQDPIGFERDADGDLVIVWEDNSFDPGEFFNTSYTVNKQALIYPALFTLSLVHYIPKEIAPLEPEPEPEGPPIGPAVNETMIINVPSTAFTGTTIPITVTDKEGHAVANILVAVLFPNGSEAQYMTSSSGQTSFHASSPGTYTYSIDGEVLASTLVNQVQQPAQPQQPTQTESQDLFIIFVGLLIVIAGAVIFFIMRKNS